MTYKNYIKKIRDFKNRKDVTCSLIDSVVDIEDSIISTYYQGGLTDHQFDSLYDEIESIRQNFVQVVYGED